MIRFCYHNFAIYHVLDFMVEVNPIELQFNDTPLEDKTLILNGLDYR